MICDACSFNTDRLTVFEWHSRADLSRSEQDLARVVTAIMTEPVTRSLPPGWQGPYDLDRAEAWIAERDQEGPTLLVVERATGEAVGLVILFEFASDEPAGVDVRLGYMLAESAWGRGLASELIAGFVEWCRSSGQIRSLAGGVASDNPASARVLEKNGFRPMDNTDVHPEGEQIFELRLRP